MPSVFEMLNRQTFRAPTNPLDKATIVSIYPRPIEEKKHTIDPGVFKIGAGTYDAPAILIVGPSSWWKEFDSNQPLLEIPQSAVVIAESVVKDYCNGLFKCEMGSQMPGLFYVAGSRTVNEIKKDFKPALDAAAAKQRLWYSELVKAGDLLWARTSGNPLSISDDMRLAAKELGLEKDWLKHYTHVEMVKCKACGMLMNPEFPICANCKAINNVEKAKALGLQFAS